MYGIAVDDMHVSWANPKIRAASDPVPRLSYAPIRSRELSPHTITLSQEVKLSLSRQRRTCIDERERGDDMLVRVPDRANVAFLQRDPY